MTSSTNIHTHYRACNLCEAICGLEITLNANQEILSIKGDEKDPFSRGHICPKAVGLKDIYLDKNRLKQPVRKTHNGWETISWEEAFTEVSSKIKDFQKQYGKDVIGVYQGNPSVHNSGTLLSAPGFLRVLGTRNRFSATSADQLPHHFAAWQMFGHPLLLPIPDIDRTDFMLIIGANPLASNGSLMTVPDVANRLKAIQKRGGKFVVIDPRKTETAKIADQHLFIKPATDVYLLLSLVHEITSQIETSEQIQQLKSIAQFYSPETVSKITGIAVEQIKSLAKDLLNAKTAVVYGRMGVSVQAFGGVCQWLINCINILTNNLDSVGGAMFPQPAFDLLGRAKKGENIFNRWQSAVRKLPEFDGELPVSAMAEDILAGGIKMLLTVCGNPVLSTSNGTQLDKALASLEYMVAVDIYINETTQHANIILPPTTGLEVAHYDVVFHNLAIRNTAKYSEPLFEKDKNQRHDWEIFEELKNRISIEEGTEIPKPKNPEAKLALAMKFGPYGKAGLTLQQLKDNPHGEDLGALKPCLKEVILTESQDINLLPDLILQDLTRVKTHAEKLLITEKNTDFDLQLIGRRHLRSNNSWMHNSERLVKGRNRCTLLIHPETANKQGVANQEIVQIESRVGKVEITVEITDEIMPDVVSIPHGFGHARAGVQLDIATAHAGVSLNDLTDELLIDELTGNAAFSGVPVRILR
ncbi:MAG: molybdopterin oxidoreductase family protein [Arcicella sp.]|nr:molybdopterin oxidoreductase family protein [Arcicella sp.]